MYSAIIKFAGKLPSINEMYLSTRTGGKYLNPKVKDLKDFIRFSLIKQGCKDYYKDISKTETLLELELIFVIKDNFFKRDCTNLIKYSEDAIVESIGIDDRFNMRFGTRKVMNDKDDFEYIIIVINEFDKNSYSVKWSEM